MRAKAGLRWAEKTVVTEVDLKFPVREIIRKI
jgi:hypothetical protein